MRILTATLLTLGSTLLCSAVTADPLSTASGDSLVSVLSSRAGKTATLKLRSGEEMTGIVGEVNESLVHLRELTGREFFDALVATKAIDAVILRTRER